MSELAGRYRLLRTLGEGGMGVVHEAEDLRLGRRVAIKMIRSAASDRESRARFLQEARAAAAVTHPNACQLHEIDESDGQPFLVMELLSGEALSTRLARGRMTVDDAVDILLAVLRGLGALHDCGLVHRDLKPSNIFLTPHGVKILDFGLARRSAAEAALDGTQTALSQPGALAGTPRYMSPEQLTGDPIDRRSDIFAAGVVLFEMLTGVRPFRGDSTLALLQSIVRDEPAPVAEAPTVSPVVLRALQKRPDDRYPNTEAMSAALAAARGVSRLSPPPGIRLVVLPFRLLRSDEELGFLEDALPEAITSSLANVPNLLVRSNLATALLGRPVDPMRAATALDVNHVLTGTVLRAGARLRVTCQLIEVPGGRVAWSGNVETGVGDLFQLQDDITRHIVDSLPIDGRRRDPLDAEVPSSAHAYQLYLRANQVAHLTAHWQTARELYEQCVAEDPDFAPAWVRLGRLYRLIGKYLERHARELYELAGQAFGRAFALHPTLPMAHHQFAYLEVEQGHADRALVRVVAQLRERPHQAELYAALCHVSRYCGLIDVSLAASARAARLDAHVRTSVANTHVLVGDFASVLRAGRGVANTLQGLALFEVGGLEEALQVVRFETEHFAPGTGPHLFGAALLAIFTDDRAAAAVVRGLFDHVDWFPDGEFHYYVARMAARCGDPDLAVAALDRALERGFFPAHAFARDPWLQPVRGTPRFETLMQQAWQRHRAAADIFDAAGGYAWLGLERDRLA